MVSSRGLVVSDADASRMMLLEALDDVPGTARQIVILNAGAALYAANVVPSIEQGIERARDTIASGAARAKLDDFVRTTQRLAAAA
jgi:anthranilate phosphoribosyltransferase